MLQRTFFYTRSLKLYEKGERLWENSHKEDLYSVDVTNISLGTLKIVPIGFFTGQYYNAA